MLYSRWDKVQGWRVHARVSAEPGQGQGPALVLVHGLSQSSRYFIPLAELLSQSCPVFVPDFPGYGLSEKPKNALSVAAMADLLAAWMSVVGLQRAVLIGNSLGCQVTAELALRHPDRLERAVLIGPTVDRRRRSAVQQIARTFLAAFYEDFSLIPRVLLDYGLAGPRRSLQALRYSLDHPIEDRLPLLRVPALVVRGDRDPLSPQAWAEEVARLLPQGRLVVIPGGGHGVHYSLARQTSRAVLAFIEEEKREL